MAENKVKVWRASRNSTAAIQITDESIQITGSSKSAIEVNSNSIGFVSKSASFGMFSENIRTGGFFVMQNDFMNLLPSTIVTPIPQRTPFPPMGFVTGFIPIVPIIMAVFTGIIGG